MATALKSLKRELKQAETQLAQLPIAVRIANLAGNSDPRRQQSYRSSPQDERRDSGSFERRCQETLERKGESEGIAMPDFRIRLNGVHIPEIRIQRPIPDGEIQLVVRDEVLGWFVVPDDPAMVLEYRDETSWALLPIPMRRDSVDKGWHQATPQELIGILWNVGVLI